MIRYLQNGIVAAVSEPEFGCQDRGLSPGGAMDLFSYRSARILLHPLADIIVLEMIWAPVIQFRKPCCFVLTGARHTDVRLFKGASARENGLVAHGRVALASSGDVLRFGDKKEGFRSYLAYASANGPVDRVVGRSRGPYRQVSRWPSVDGAVRVVPGPEHGRLAQASAFFEGAWRISRDSSPMGIRLERDSRPLELRDYDMVSSPVSDGTVQWTPAGPVVLMRHRQTVGGYPRIFNVIGADMDRLAQFAPDNRIRFREVSLKRAVAVARLQAEDLRRLQARCS